MEILGLILHNCLVFEEEKVKEANTSILIPTKSTTETTSKQCVVPTDDRLQSAFQQQNSSVSVFIFSFNLYSRKENAVCSF